MAQDLMKNVLNGNMHKDDLLVLLGPPDKDIDNEYYYILGMCSGYDLDILHLKFESNGKLLNAKIKQH
jgi:hypothetical protein